MINSSLLDRVMMKLMENGLAELMENVDHRPGNWKKKSGRSLKRNWPIQFPMDMSKWKCSKKERRGRAVVTCERNGYQARNCRFQRRRQRPAAARPTDPPTDRPTDRGNHRHNPQPIGEKKNLQKTIQKTIQKLIQKTIKKKNRNNLQRKEKEKEQKKNIADERDVKLNRRIFERILNGHSGQFPTQSNWIVNKWKCIETRIIFDRSTANSIRQRCVTFGTFAIANCQLTIGTNLWHNMQNLDFYANEPWLKSRSGIDARNKPSIFFLLPFCFSKFVVYFSLSNFRYFLFFSFIFCSRNRLSAPWPVH